MTDEGKVVPIGAARRRGKGLDANARRVAANRAVLEAPLEELRVVVVAARRFPSGPADVLLAELDFGDGVGRGAVFDFGVEVSRDGLLGPGEVVEVLELALPAAEVLERGEAMILSDDDDEGPER